MSSVAIAAFAFAGMLAGFTAGLLLQSRLPSHHLNDASKETIKLGAALLSTLTALVLGLLVSSATSTFHTASNGVTTSAARAILLDELLAAYGPETTEIRQQLRKSLGTALAALDSSGERQNGAWQAAVTGGKTISLVDSVRMLEPSSRLQTSLYPRAIELSQDLLEAHWMLLEEDIPFLPPLLITALLLWLSTLHVTYGLFAPRNATVLTVVIFCALSLSAALFLIKEMNRPLDGLVRVSAAPLRAAMERLAPLAH